MKTLIATVLMIFGCISPILAQQISCGDPPKIQSSVEQKLKADAEGKAQLLTKLLGNADLKGAVETSRTELYQQHQDVGKDEINLYFAWVSCQTISSDKTLSSSDKLSQWIQIYKVLLARGPTDQEAQKSKTKTAPPADSSIFFVDGLKFSVKRLIFSPATHMATLIIAVININDDARRIVFLPPYPTLTDEDGNSGRYYGAEGVQVCIHNDAQLCAKQGGLLLTPLGRTR